MKPPPPTLLPILYMTSYLYAIGVCPSERFLDPPPLNFVHAQISIYLAIFGLG